MPDSKAEPTTPSSGTNVEIAGFLIFTAIGMLSISRFGFLFHIPIPADMSIALCALAGAIGGMLMFRSYLQAGLIGGSIAGVTGFLGLSWYVPFRGSTTLSSFEVILVQIVASLPGVAIGFAIYWLYYRPQSGVSGGG